MPRRENDCCEETKDLVILRCSMRHLLLAIVLCCLFGSLQAQGYVVKGRCTKPIKSPLFLTVFDGDSSYHNSRFRAYDQFYFKGSVREPVLAALSSKALPQPIYFFIENSNITVSIDVDNPAASHINGSLINSQFRYDMESCKGENQELCMAEYVRNHPSSIFSTFLLSERLSTLPVSTIVELFQLLSGPAKTAYHYKQIRHRLASMQVSIEGQRLPDFEYVDTSGRRVSFDSLIDSSRANVVLVGAAWCESCRRAVQELRDIDSLAKGQVIQIDQQPEAWDAPSLRMLSVDHIPFLILMDSAGRIVNRDIRSWELRRELKSMSH
ncbi:MAG: DUF4369 domain-containing protein [Bacteroidales bacterium]|nr:DUF4369 domain-containing protein [Candidatus Colimorpha onthohippi]